MTASRAELKGETLRSPGHDESWWIKNTQLVNTCPDEHKRFGSQHRGMYEAYEVYVYENSLNWWKIQGWRISHQELDRQVELCLCLQTSRIEAN